MTNENNAPPDPLEVAESGGIVLTMNRPAVKNALDMQQWRRLTAALDDAKYDTSCAPWC